MSDTMDKQTVSVKQQEIERFIGGMDPHEQDMFRRALAQTGAGQPVTASGADVQSAGGASDRLYTGPRAASHAVTLDNVEECFTFQPPDRYTFDRMTEVREASIAMARVLLRSVPDCPDRSTALRKLREVRMWANSALALRGRF